MRVMPITPATMTLRRPILSERAANIGIVNTWITWVARLIHRTSERLWPEATAYGTAKVASRDWTAKAMIVARQAMMTARGYLVTTSRIGFRRRAEDEAVWR